jgi:hypothetical protein
MLANELDASRLMHGPFHSSSHGPTTTSRHSKLKFDKDPLIPSEDAERPKQSTAILSFPIRRGDSGLLTVVQDEKMGLFLSLRTARRNSESYSNKMDYNTKRDILNDEQTTTKRQVRKVREGDSPKGTSHPSTLAAGLADTERRLNAVGVLNED